jgi:hypothetical protein
LRLTDLVIVTGAGLLTAIHCSASAGRSAMPTTPLPMQDAADSRTAAPPVTGPAVREIHPSGSFDVVQAKAALEPGSGTIAGAACVCRFVHNGPTTFTRADREVVVLYPDSPYIEDMLKLLHKTKPGAASVVADPAITAIRLEGHTNENGQFQFSKIKPGSYFVVAAVHSTNTGTRSVYTGTGYSSDAFGGFSTDYYQKQNYYVNYDDILYERVEVQSGEEAHVTLFGGTSLFGFNAMKAKCR